MNPYLKNLEKIEFAVTYACTGRCKHCSVGDGACRTDRIDPEMAADAVKRIASAYSIRTVMTFGGEPLLHTDAVYAVMEAAKEMGIRKRQVITNGFFSGSEDRICEVAEGLSSCGVNDLLLSVDAFHQETIPLATVRKFAEAALQCGIPMRLSPAWLVSREDENPYNRKTKEILKALSDLGIAEGAGNVIFPEGNAVKYLAEYFMDTLPENPYAEDPRDVHCVSFSPNGDVLDGNAYRTDIMEILEGYRPLGEGK